MNELYITINFSKQKFIINGVDLISGDYNSTKMIFTFEDYQDKTKIVEIRPANAENKNPTFMATVINNEVILVSKDDENHNVTPFPSGGVYYMEVSAYSDDSKLSTITKSFNVLDDEIIVSDEIVSPYLPVFDELIEEIIKVTNEASNVNIDLYKINGVTTVSITNKNGITKTVQILDGKDGIDGVDGVGIQSITKTNTTGLVDTYTITYTNNTTTTFQVTNGNGIANIEKTGTSGLVDTYTITYTNGTTSTFTVTNGDDNQEIIDYISKYANALIKNTNTGTSLTINDTAECPMPMSLAPSETSQEGTPTPENSQTIHTVSGNNTITVANSDNTESQTLPLNLGTIELCYLTDGSLTCKDYFYKDSDKWYLHKETDKQVLVGTEENISIYSSTSSRTVFKCPAYNVLSNMSIHPIFKSTHFIAVTQSTTWAYGMVSIRAGNNDLFYTLGANETIDDFKAWLINNNVTTYYGLATPTNTEITDSTLISQLENIYNWALSYQTQTNITQTNADLPFVITAITCYDLNKLLIRVETLESEA